MLFIKELIFFRRNFSTLVELNKYSNKVNKKITINNLLKYKSINKNYRIKLLNEELKSRISEKIVELENFPYGISMMPSIKKVNEWYIQTFKELEEADLNKKREYNKILENIYDRHSSTLITVANGIMEYKDYIKEIYGDNFVLGNYLKFNNRGKIIDNYLNTFYTNRISIRLLISHYLELENSSHNNIHQNGIVSINEPLTCVIEEASEIASFICEKNYNYSPNVIIENMCEKSVFPYIRNNMFYIFLEILKNSMKGTIDKGNELNDIIVKVFNNDDVITVKISDNGIGIKHKNLKYIWSYFFSTANIQRIILDYDDIKDFDKSTPLAGFGYGLPITKMSVNYFNDDISITSIEGNGTDVVLHFQKNNV
jgi:signal transduction histidine kinase